ncbi:MAG TPA: hypothetical protein VLW06_03855, partial [Terriglobales bacterium]|nr:hypothetical protein [Terriglobales bacterium]
PPVVSEELTLPPFGKFWKSGFAEHCSARTGVDARTHMFYFEIPRAAWKSRTRGKERKQFQC